MEQDTHPAQPHPHQHRGRDAPVLHGLRDVRDHRPRAARRARRPQARQPPRALRHAADGPAAGPALPQVRQDRRRGDGQLPPARRPGHLRHPRAHGAAVQHAGAPRGRAGQLRLGGRGPPGRAALHRGAAHAARRLDDGGHREGDGRLPADLRRQLGRADRAADRAAEPARQRRGGHRGRHGHEHPAPQPRRGRGRDHLPPREPGPHARREARGHDRPHPRAGLPDRRLHHGARGDPAGLPHRPRLRGHARARRDRGAQERPRVDRHHRDPLPGQQGAAHREDRGPRPRRARPRHRGRARRERPAGHAGGRGREEGRARTGRPEQPVQAHAAAGHLRGDLPRHRRPAAAGAEHPRRLRALRRLPPRRGAPAHGLRAAQGRGARPRPRGLRDRARPPRRGDRAHPRRAQPGDREAGPPRPLRAQRDPGGRDPQAPAAAADRPRAAEDRRRARRAASCASPTCKDILASAKRIDAIIGEELQQRSATRTGTRAAPRSWAPRTRSRSRT